MTTEMLQYDKMVESALKGVVRNALRQVQAEGLPDNHHFYITFRTGDEGVKIPEYLSDKYEREMTIVLQYQFYNLNVTEKLFSVSLSFNNNMEDLVVPFDAITGFADPSVKFGLQFQNNDLEDFDADEFDDLELAPADILSLAEMVEEATEEIQKNKGSDKTSSSKVSGKQDDKKTAKKSPAKKTAKKEQPEDSGDKVISLDTFRKK